MLIYKILKVEKVLFNTILLYNSNSTKLLFVLTQMFP